MRLITSAQRGPIAAAVFMLGLGLSIGPAAAQTDDTELRQLFEAMELPAMIEIMREEGLDYGDQLGREMFTGGGSNWQMKVAEIYEPDAMSGAIFDLMAAALEGRDLRTITAFYGSEPGLTIVGLELAARTAMLDDDVEEMANEAAAIALADETARADQLIRFAEVNDLIEGNVAGGMNASLAFYLGLLEGGAFPAEMTEGQLLSEVWAQEPDIRESTTEWVYSFLNLAYQPLSDADLEAYIAFSETEPGQQLNRAMFSAFDEVFNRISGELGRGAAYYMLTDQI